MRYLTSSLNVAVAVVALVGCGQSTTGPISAPRGGVAVVDLDQVAQNTGKTQEIVDAVRLREAALTQKLLQVQQSFRDQIDTKKKEFGDTPSPEQTQQLARLQIEANNRLTQAKRNIQGNLQQYRQQLAAKFRLDVKPIVEAVAEAKGIGAVIPRNDGLLLSVSPGLDITKEVTEAVRAQRPQPVAAPVSAANTAAVATPAAAPALAAPAVEKTASAEPAGSATSGPQ